MPEIFSFSIVLNVFKINFSDNFYSRKISNKNIHLTLYIYIGYWAKDRQFAKIIFVKNKSSSSK